MAVSRHALQTRRTVWHPAHRLIPSRFPPIGLFDRVADPADLDAVYAVEALTNDRIREETGALTLVDAAERVSGPGTTPIMAAFTHVNPEGSRFSDATLGVWYCSRELPTALAEVRYHQERFLRRTQETALRVEMRLYVVDVDARLVDVRKLPECHLRDDYGPSRAVGVSLRAAKRDGVLYQSVRRAKGHCAAIFRPKVLSRCRQAKHYALHFDGERVVSINEMTNVWTAGA
ncbi:MAG: RES family NAD+ phosphorylase [Betaproteobacteria bacterium]|nr:RES family NAD+ phosphorylase [Betaproteobacteria bacterium]MBA3775473.1 RES family NAD+ phosphorylase [Betaproteobacteria bacterium]